MIVYTVDKSAQSRSYAQVRKMDSLLADIPATLELLKRALAQQESALSSPSIDQYRAELSQMIDGAITLTTAINHNTQQLVTISDQTTKHLLAVDEHFSSALRSNPSASSANSSQTTPNA